MKKKLKNNQSVWLENGYIFFEDNFGNFDECSGQTIADDSYDYRYDHGGKLYKEACKLFWSIEN